ncbi:MAG: adenosylcobinamide-GDP ribazoletransferase [Candidatus Methanomethylophilus sp.]|nr:adenosylcobinamide-GDP ribazoletransferase [Methanomethylophilus sp.]
MSEQNDDGRTWTGPLTASSPEDYEKKEESKVEFVEEEPVQAAPAEEPAAEPVKKETEDLDTLLKQGWDIVVAKVGEDKAEDLSDEEAMAIIREEDEALYNKIVSLSPKAEEKPAAEEPVQDVPAQEEAAPAETTALTETETRPAPAGNMEPVKNSRMRSINTSGIMGAIKCMLSFFTIIRINVDEKDMEAMDQNFWLAPVIGLITGIVGFIACLIFAVAGLSFILVPCVALASVYIFTKFLHFDGLADFGDGIVVSSASQEDHVRALKDSRVGAGGLGVALTVVLLTLVAYMEFDNMFASIIHWRFMMGVPMAVLSVEVLVKYSQVVAASFGNPGNGMASNQVRNSDMNSFILSSVLTLILLAITTVIGWAMIRYSCVGAVGIPGWEVGLLFVVGFGMAILVGLGMARYANKTFGFVNGDILGATNEISRCAMLLTVLLVAGLIAVW